jgi:hypothetical protein
MCGEHVQQNGSETNILHDAAIRIVQVKARFEEQGRE